MKIILSVCLLIFLHVFELMAQADTHICYDCRTKQMEIIPLPQNNSAIDFDHTSWNFGLAESIAQLDTSKQQNTFPGSGFSNLFPTQHFFNIYEYPIRTAVKIFRFSGDSLIQKQNY